MPAVRGLTSQEGFLTEECCEGRLRSTSLAQIQWPVPKQVKPSRKARENEANSRWMGDPLFAFIPHNAASPWPDSCRPRYFARKLPK